MLKKSHELVDHQFNEWLSQVKKRKEVTKKPPVITISREWCSGGLRIADVLIKKLGKPWKMWDKEIIEEIARRAEVRLELVQAVDEKSQSQFEALLSNVFAPQKKLEPTEYRMYLGQVLLSIAHFGHAIIIGRGANFIVPDAFRVRVVASRWYRADITKQYEKVSEVQAQEMIKKSDHEREAFVKQYFNENINDPWLYDLVVKTNYINIETAADMIIKGASDKLGSLKLPG